jgi:hypothetical protein
MLNEKRQAIMAIEKLSGVQLLVVANSALETPQYKVDRIRKSELDEKDDTASYQRVIKEDQFDIELTKEKPIQPERAAVSSISPGQRPVAPPPVVEVKPAATGLLGRIVSIFSGDKSAKTEEKVEIKPESERSRSQRPGQSRTRSSSNRGRSRSRSRKPEGGQDATKTTGNKAADKAAEKAAKESADNVKEGAKTGGQSSRGRRRRSSRSRNTEAARQGDSQQNVSAASAPSSAGQGRDDTSSASSNPAKRAEKAAVEKPNTSQPAEAGNAVSEKQASDKSKVENRPAAAEVKSTGSGDKQPVSNENRPVTSSIDD